MKKKMIPKLNLNEREKERFAKSLRRIAEHCHKLAYAIELGNDEESVKEFLMFSIGSMSIRDLGDIITKAIENMGSERKSSDDIPFSARVPDFGFPNFPDFIKDED